MANEENIQSIENLLQAIDIIASQRAIPAGYDKTIRVTITAVQDIDNGMYEVSDGLTTYTAYSENDTYALNDVVYITIPSNDATETIFITGKYLGNANTQSLINASQATDNFVEMTENLLSNNLSASLPISNTFQKQSEIIWTADATILDQIQHYDRALLRLDLSNSFKQECTIISGDYQLALYISSNDLVANNVYQTQQHIFTFSNQDVLGAQYNFKKSRTESCVFNLDGLGTIEAMQLILSHEDNFLTKENIADVTGVLEISNVELYFGYDITDFQSSAAIIYTTDNDSYDASNNKKTLHTCWIRETEEGFMAIDHDNELPAGVNLHWYRYDPENTAGDIFIDNSWTQIISSNNTLTSSVPMDQDLPTTQYQLLIENRQQIFEEFTDENTDNAYNDFVSETADVITFNVEGYDQSLSDVEYFTLALTSCFNPIDDNHFDDYVSHLVTAYEEHGYTDRSNLLSVVVEEWEDALASSVYVLSNILQFTNTDYDINTTKKQLINSFEITADAATYGGKYMLYKDDGEIYDPLLAQQVRTISASYNTLYTDDDTADEADLITWYIPLENTMIQTPQEGVEYVVADSDITNETELLDNEYDIVNSLSMEDYALFNFPCKYMKITRRVDPYFEDEVVNNQIMRYGEQYFRIKSIYVPNFTNNTIFCSLKKNGYTYTSSTSLSFGTRGTNGLDVTFFLEMRQTQQEDQKYKILEENSTGLFLPQPLGIVPRLFDETQEEITDYSNISIKYTWLTPTTTGALSIQHGDSTLLAPHDQCVFITANPDIATLTNSRYHILKAELEWTIPLLKRNQYGYLVKEEGETVVDDTHERIVTLSTYLPIPVYSTQATNLGILDFTGANKIIYNSMGTNPQYYNGTYFYTLDETLIQDLRWLQGNSLTYLCKPHCAEMDNSQTQNTFRLDKSAYPQFDSATRTIVPTNLYLFDDTTTMPQYSIDLYAVWNNDIRESQLEWICTYPIYIAKNRYDSAVLTDWDGSFSINPAIQSKVLASMVGAGTKNKDNQFSGVIMGDVTGAVPAQNDKEELPQTTGLYGVKDGEFTFGLNTDGTAFLGGSSSGRIEFDGTRGTIQSANFEITKDENNKVTDIQGTKLDLATGKLWANDAILSGDIYASGLHINTGFTATDADSSFKDFVADVVDQQIDSGKLNLIKSVFIAGTQTTATNAWTGVAPFSTLRNGQQIFYWLPYNNNTNTAVTLQLTLTNDDNTNTVTNAIPCYLQRNNPITTQFSADQIIALIYREDYPISGVNGWWTTNTNLTDYVQYTNGINVANADIQADHVIAYNGTQNGYISLAANTAINIDVPILYTKNACTNNTTVKENVYTTFSQIPINTLTQQSLSSGKALYAKGILDGTIFTVVADTTTAFTTTVPNYNDGYDYLLLGTVEVDTHPIYFSLAPEHPIYRYSHGKFKTLSQIAYEAQNSFDNLIIGGRNYWLNTENYKLEVIHTPEELTNSTIKTTGYGGIPLYSSALFTPEDFAGKEMTLSFDYMAEGVQTNMSAHGNNPRYGLSLSFGRIMQQIDKLNSLEDFSTYISQPEPNQIVKVIKDNIQSAAQKTAIRHTYYKYAKDNTTNTWNWIYYSARKPRENFRYIEKWLTPEDGNGNGRIEYTFTVPTDWDGYINIHAAYIQRIAAEHIVISKPQLELGNKATAWTPAPEDEIINLPNHDNLLSNTTLCNLLDTSTVPSDANWTMFKGNDGTRICTSEGLKITIPQPSSSLPNPIGSEWFNVSALLDNHTIQLNEPLVFSCDVKVLTTDMQKKVYLCYACFNDRGSATDVLPFENWYTKSILISDTRHPAESNKWVRMAIIFPGVKDLDLFYKKMAFGIGVNSDAETEIKVLIKNIKLEKGIKHTPWTITPVETYTQQQQLSSYLQENLDAFQQQLDGKVELITSTIPPTVTDEPAKTWIANNTAASHVGDLCLDTTTGHMYKFSSVTENEQTTYNWTQLSTDYLSDISSLINQLDNRTNVFVTQPNQYEQNDLYFKDGQLYKSLNSHTGGFVATDWQLLTDYLTADLGNKNYFAHSDTFIMSGSEAPHMITAISANCSTDVEIDGTWKLVIDDDQTVETVGWMHENSITQNFQAGDPFTLSFDMKTDSSNTTCPKLRIFENGNFINGVGQLSDSWTRCSYSGQWPNNATSLDFTFNFNNLPGTYYICRLKFEKSTMATPWNLSDALADTVSMIDTEYYLHNSATVQPEENANGWQTDPPTWVKEHYIWSRQMTKYADGTITYTNYKCITNTDAKIVKVQASSMVFKKYNTTYAPQRVCLTPSLSGALQKDNIQWFIYDSINKDWQELQDEDLNNSQANYYKDMNGCLWITAKTEPTRSIVSGVDLFASNNDLKIKCAITETINGTDQTYFDEVTIVKLQDGEKGAQGDKGDKGDQGDAGYTVVLDNEVHTFGANAYGYALEADPSVTLTPTIYQGTTELTNANYSISIADSVDIGEDYQIVSVDSQSGSLTLHFTTTQSLQNGVIPLLIIFNGVTIVKRFSYAVSRTGRGVQSVIEQYYIADHGNKITNENTSNTDWINQRPSVISLNKFVWARNLITYSDNTVEYTTPIRAYEFDALKTIINPNYIIGSALGDTSNPKWLCSQAQITKTNDSYMINTLIYNNKNNFSGSSYDNHCYQISDNAMYTTIKEDNSIVEYCYQCTYDCSDLAGQTVLLHYDICNQFTTEVDRIEDKTDYILAQVKLSNSKNSIDLTGIELTSYSLTEAWEHYVWKFTIPADGSTPYLHLQFITNQLIKAVTPGEEVASSSIVNIYIKDLKLEVGEVETDWSAHENDSANNDVNLLNNSTLESLPVTFQNPQSQYFDIAQMQAQDDKIIYTPALANTEEDNNWSIFYSMGTVQNQQFTIVDTQKKQLFFNADTGLQAQSFYLPTETTDTSEGTVNYSLIGFDLTPFTSAIGFNKQNLYHFSFDVYIDTTDTKITDQLLYYGYANILNTQWESPLTINDQIQWLSQNTQLCPTQMWVRINIIYPGYFFNYLSNNNLFFYCYNSCGSHNSNISITYRNIQLENNYQPSAWSLSTFDQQKILEALQNDINNTDNIIVYDDRTDWSVQWHGSSDLLTPLEIAIENSDGEKTYPDQTVIDFELKYSGLPTISLDLLPKTLTEQELQIIPQFYITEKGPLAPSATVQSEQITNILPTINDLFNHVCWVRYYYIYKHAVDAVSVPIRPKDFNQINHEGLTADMLTDHPTNYDILLTQWQKVSLQEYFDALLPESCVSIVRYIDLTQRNESYTFDKMGYFINLSNNAIEQPNASEIILQQNWADKNPKPTKYAKQYCLIIPNSTNKTLVARPQNYSSATWASLFNIEDSQQDLDLIFTKALDQYDYYLTMCEVIDTVNQEESHYTTADLRQLLQSEIKNGIPNCSSLFMNGTNSVSVQEFINSLSANFTFLQVTYNVSSESIFIPNDLRFRSNNSALELSSSTQSFLSIAEQQLNLPTGQASLWSKLTNMTFIKPQIADKSLIYHCAIDDGQSMLDQMQQTLLIKAVPQYYVSDSNRLPEDDNQTETAYTTIIPSVDGPHQYVGQNDQVQTEQQYGYMRYWLLTLPALAINNQVLIEPYNSSTWIVPTEIQSLRTGNNTWVTPWQSMDVELKINDNTRAYPCYYDNGKKMLLPTFSANQKLTLTFDTSKDYATGWYWVEHLNDIDQLRADIIKELNIYKEQNAIYGNALNSFINNDFKVYQESLEKLFYSLVSNEAGFTLFEQTGDGYTFGLQKWLDTVLGSLSVVEVVDDLADTFGEIWEKTDVNIKKEYQCIVNGQEVGPYIIIGQKAIDAETKKQGQYIGLCLILSGSKVIFTEMPDITTNNGGLTMPIAYMSNGAVFNDDLLASDIVAVDTLTLADTTISTPNYFVWQNQNGHLKLTFSQEPPKSIEHFNF